MMIEMLDTSNYSSTPVSSYRVNRTFSNPGCSHNKISLLRINRSNLVPQIVNREEEEPMNEQTDPGAVNQFLAKLQQTAEDYQAKRYALQNMDQTTVDFILG